MGELFDFLRQASGKLGIPAEILTGLPTVELSGNYAVMIEQHRGVCAYSDCAVSVRTNLGLVIIEGCGLTIHVMNQDRILVYGTICCVRLEEKRR